MAHEESFGRMVRERRRALDLTQEELARRVGCAAVTIRKIEYDEIRPSVQIAERLAMALAIPLDDRAEFVRQARAVRPERAQPPTPTPMPRPEEIGAEDLSGRAIRGYTLGERIGAGGFGVVYRGVQPLVEREVAVKIILPRYANHPEFIRRFEAEAQLVARLEHPHIVPLYDYWREPGVAYLVMRLLRGGSVLNMLHSGPLALEMVARMIEQIGAALHAAHRVGVVHRDLKPANVLLDEDANAYLADFGIAKNLGNPNLEDQTQADVIVGSPAYFSPEQIRSETVKPQADIYSLGIMLYELLTGARPFQGPTPIDLIQQHLTAPLPPLAAHRAGLPAVLDAVIARATAKDPRDRYPDIPNLLADLRRVVAGGPAAVLDTVYRVPTDGELPEPENPYKGLRAFGEADAADFFGRETLVQQLLARLAEGGDLARFLAVVGPSGSGKSSVVGAGLVPALRRGGLPGSENWFVVELIPGAHPLEELEAALLRIAVNPPESLLAQLQEDDRGLLRAVRRCLPDDPNVELVLVIDQFEEVFTLVHAEREAVRANLLKSLVTAVLDERSRVRIVVTLRADFTDRPLRYVDFGELLQKRSEFVLPLTPDELERAILGPAERVGLQLETGLAAAIMHDVGDQPGALPLLQYALTELFEKREGRTLTKKAYAEVGGVLGALGRRAEEVFASLGEAGQETARQLFLRLVTLGEGTEDTRRRVLRAEVMAVADAPLTPALSPLGRGSAPPLSLLGRGVGGEGRMTMVIDAFGKHRLLSFDRDPLTRGPTVEVAHEALLREWARLREWLQNSRADVRLQRQLANAAAEWQSANREQSFLLSGVRLAQFEGWAAGSAVALTHEERAYLAASIAEREKQAQAEQARQRRELEAARKLAETERQSAIRLRTRNRVITAVGALAILAAIVAAIFGGQANTAANRNATLAIQNAAIASTAQAANTQEVAQRSTAQAAEAQALDEAQSRATQQAIAEAERDRAEQEKQLAASRELAIAAVSNLEVDPERSVLLALHGLSQTYTREAEEALHRAVQALRVQFTLRGHMAHVAYSPDGMRLATVSDDGSVKFWDTATGQELLTLKTAPDGSVSAVAFSPDGARLAAAVENGLVRVWDVKTVQELLVFPGHSDYINGIVFSPDGARLATASNDGTAKVWDAVSGKELFTLSGHTSWVNSVAFSPDGTRLATVSDDGTAKIWDAVTGRELLTLSGEAILLDVAFSPDGAKLATGRFDGVAMVWDVASGQELLRLSGHTNLILDLAFSPDGAQLATASGDATAKLWDAVSGQELITLAGHTGFVNDVDFSPDGVHLATAGSTDLTARIWDISPAGSRELLTIAGGPFRNVAFSLDEKRIITASFDRTARVWDATTGQELLVLSGHADRVYNAVFSPDGARIATASADNTAKLWDAATGKELLALSGHSEGVVGGLFPGVLDVAFSPDGTKIVTTGADGVAKLWEAATGKELLTFSGHTAGLTNVAFSPDGTKIATASDAPDGTARVWEAATGKELLTLSGHQTRRIWGLAFSPDGARLVTSGFGGIVKVWDVASGQELLNLVGHTSTVNGASFSADGARLATTGGDGARIRDAANGEELLTLSGHTGGLWAAVFNNDGSRLVTASTDGTVRIYALNLEDLIALAKSRVTRSLTTEECQKYLHVEACPGD